VAMAHSNADAPEPALGRFLGLRCTHEEEADGFVERMFPVGGSFVQTLTDAGPGVIRRFLDRRGPGLHHLAFSVDGIDAAVDDLASQGVRMIDSHPRPGGMGTRIAFVHPEAFSGVLVELVEETSEEISEPAESEGNPRERW
jgi:methylmalonyl-CoA epimerase